MVHKGKRAYRGKAAPEANVEDSLFHGEDRTESRLRHDPGRKAKIIVRNLPFKGLSEDSLKEIFQDFGDITDVNLLRKDDGKYVGCGFVQFSSLQSAAKAIHHINGKEISGRPIIVDWAIPKDTFIQKAQEVNQEVGVKKEINSDDENDNIETLDFSIDTKPEKKRKIKHESDSEEEEDEDDEEEDEDDDEGDDDEEEMEVKEEPRRSSNDVEEGKTVFVKNVPFSVNNDDLKSAFQQFGSVLYAVVCVDPITEHSRGTAFVKFKEKENAEVCLKTSQILVHDSPVEVTLAMSREALQSKKKLKKTVKDSRNLYLIREGVVMAGSSAADGLSATDMAKRLQIEQWKSTILRNLHMFLSKTRLVVHNLPPSYDDAQLKGLFQKYSGANAVVREARIMRDRKNVGANGLGASKEVGFVAFTTHEDALAALRMINNNPMVFTAKRRPIVGFSIENKEILNLKQKRVERSQAKLGVKDELKSEKLNKKQRRAIKRRQNLIKKRQDAKKVKRGEKIEEARPEPEKKPEKRKNNIKPGVAKKKRKIEVKETETTGPGEFSGILAEPGKQVKLRSRFKLKTQATIHKQKLKAEKSKKRQQRRENTKLESIREPKQKKGKPKNVNDDAKFTKLISQYKKKIETSASFKKWYEK